MEYFFTRDPASTNNCSTLFSFSDGTTADHLLASPCRGGNDPNSNHFALGFQQTGVNNNNEYLLVGPILSEGSTDMAVGSFNSTTGVASLYVNGAIVAQTPAGTGTGFNLSATATQDGINGSSPYGGYLAMDGSTADFRINDATISVSQAALNYLAGPGRA